MTLSTIYGMKKCPFYIFSHEFFPWSHIPTGHLSTPLGWHMGISNSTRPKSGLFPQLSLSQVLVAPSFQPLGSELGVTLDSFSLTSCLPTNPAVLPSAFTQNPPTSCPLYSYYHSPSRDSACLDYWSLVSNFAPRVCSLHSSQNNPGRI